MQDQLTSPKLQPIPQLLESPQPHHFLQSQSSTCTYKVLKGTTSRSPSSLMSHPKAEAGVEAEEEAEVGEEEEELPKKIDSMELAEDNLPSGEIGNQEVTEEEEDRNMIKAQM